MTGRAMCANWEARSSVPTPLHDFAKHGPAAQDQSPATRDAGSESQVGRRIVSIAELEREAILGTIRELKGDKLMAAKLLGIGKTTLYRKLKEYGVSDGLDEEN